MRINVVGYSSGKESSLGVMFINGKFACYTLEDEKRSAKVYGKTRIPRGTYRIGFRKVGGFNSRYKKKFPLWHGGMLEILNVPNFKYVLIHIGNKDDDTAGCILVGNTANNNTRGDGFIGYSTQAYKRIYPIISEALRMEPVWITLSEIHI